MSNDKKDKNTVIALLAEGELTGREIAKRTGFVPSRVSQIKKEWEQNGKHLPAPTEADRSPAPVNEIPNWVEAQLQEAMIQCIENLKNGIPTDQTTIDCIMMIATLMRELYYAPLPTHPTGFRGREGIHEGQDPATATGDRISFMERLEKLSGRSNNNG